LKEENLNIQSDDFALIDSFKKGNVNSFNILVLKYQRKIYWVIRKMVLNHLDADDLTQETFIKVYKSLQDFRGDSKFFTYLYKIAVNLSLNHLKREKIIMSRTGDFETEGYKIKSDEKDYDEISEEQERTKILEEAIGRLPAQQRAVFNMRFYDQLSYEDISLILNKSTGGMKANYFHAFKKIEEYLKQKKALLYEQ